MKKTKLQKSLLLLTNDDGYFSPGIKALFGELKKLGEAYIVAPDQERSACSLSLTLNRPLAVSAVKKRIFAVSGTPADCVYIALQKILPRKPDLLLSGLNQGPNLGQQDVSYSGTVAGAIQGSFLQIPSAAISVIPDEEGKFFFEFAARFASRFAQSLLEIPLPAGVTLNINIPPPPVRGIKIAKLGQKKYNPEIITRDSGQNQPLYLIGPGNPRAFGDGESDVAVVKEGYISITPLHTDLTDYQAISFLKGKDILSSIEHEISKKTL